MRFSIYNIPFATNNSKYVYNTLSTAIAKLDEQTYSAILQNSLCKIPVQNISAMQQQNFIVEDDIDEKQQYLYFYNRTRFGKSPSVFGLTLIPTYGCNLACPYCIQGLNKTYEVISDEKLQEILLFIDNELKNSMKTNNPIKTVAIGLFGGEPMLCPDILVKFCQKVNLITRKYSCSLHFTLTSNMTLLNDRLIDLIQEFQIGIQVSIDGVKEDHDKRRVKKDGTGTYDVILNNLKKLCDTGLKHLITIRVNLDTYNIDKAEEIIQNLKPFSDDIYFAFLEVSKGKNDAFCDNCIQQETYSTYISRQLDPLLQKYNFMVTPRFGKQTPCSLNCENKFFVDYFLNVYKCELFINRLDGCVGKIENGIFIPNGKFYQQINHSPEKFKECMTCKLLPLCAGGCAAKAYISSGQQNGCLNEKSCTYTMDDLLTYLKSYVEFIEKFKRTNSINLYPNTL